MLSAAASLRGHASRVHFHWIASREPESLCGAPADTVLLRELRPVRTGLRDLSPGNALLCRQSSTARMDSHATAAAAWKRERGCKWPEGSPRRKDACPSPFRRERRQEKKDRNAHPVVCPGFAPGTSKQACPQAAS